MKLKLNLLAGAVLTGVVPFAIWAQSEPAEKLAPVTVASNPVRLGAEKPVYDFTHIQVKNFQGESLGRIMDLGIDLINGRIVEVLVVSDSSLGDGKKIVAVPPFAFVPDLVNEVYRLDISAEEFKAAEGIKLTHWTDAGRSERVAATYHYFGQNPYFLEEGAAASTTDQRPKVALGYVERSSKILDMPVGNLQGEKLGKVSALTLNIPTGRILSVIVVAGGNLKTRSIIPAMALSFNDTRDRLLLDDTKLEYAEEPRYILTEPAYGHGAYEREEPYKGPHTTVALEQGTSYRDVDTTARIHQDLRASKVNNQHVQVGTINDRVTLRGWVNSSEDKRRIGEIAVRDSRLELVDNQITVGEPVALK